MGFKNAHRLARLHQQSFIILKLFEGPNDSVISIPVARGLTCSAIYDQLAWALANFLVEIVHQHSHRGFLLPAFAGKRIAARRSNAGVCGSFSFDWHKEDGSAKSSRDSNGSGRFCTARSESV